jgi:1,4-dihydroxy-6-naphthoate synthase
VLCPGKTTTATLLYHCLHPHQGTISQAVFTDIGPALLRGDADLGVLIHEGRLTYQRDGLTLVEDLGTSFERLSDAPVPLGGILADRALPDGVAAEFASLLRESIAYGWANRDEALVTIRRHAQEMDESVIWPYVELYVNDHTVDLGPEGARALAVLERTGRAAGLFAGDLPPLTVVG